MKVSLTVTLELTCILAASERLSGSDSYIGRNVSKISLKTSLRSHQILQRNERPARRKRSERQRERRAVEHSRRLW